MSEADLNSFRAAILRQVPELSGATFRRLAEGWDSVAIEADGRLVFKFPKDETAEKALRKEAALLVKVRPRLTMPVPDMRIHDGPPTFSSHEKLQGEQLLTEGYVQLPEEARDRLAEDLARFYAELHGLEVEEMAEAGAGIEVWQSPETVRQAALPALAPGLRRYAEETILEFERLAADPYGQVYGFFDGHGWNMAFDFQRLRLNGIYDFADSGIGPLHQDFIYSSFISDDLTGRIIAAYEAVTGRPLDRRRIFILTGYHRLSELAELADDPENASIALRFAEEWLKRQQQAR